MDAASRAALRLSIEVALGEARAGLARCHDELTARRAEVARSSRSLEALRTDRRQWAQEPQAFVGRILTAGELVAWRLRGEAIEARSRDLTLRLTRLHAATARAEREIEGLRQGVGEALARQRWLDDDERRDHDARERRRAQRDDDE